MVNDSNRVTLEVAVQTQQEQIDELEARMQRLQSEKLQVDVEAEHSALDEVNQELEFARARLDDLKGNVEVESNELTVLQTELDATLESLESMTADVTVDDSELQSLESYAEELQSQIETLTTSISVDTAEIDELESTISELEATQIELPVNVDASGLDEVKTSVDELAGSVDNAAASAGGLDSALAGIAGAAAGAGLMQMVDTAGNIETSWDRLGLTFGSVTEQMKSSIDSAAAATGRSGGSIRSYFNQMGIAGVKNTDLLSQSFTALSGRAYQTGKDVNAMSNVLQRMVMSGNVGARQLTQLGISTEDLGRAMGVTADEATKAFQSLSQEDRLRVLTDAMGDGKQANEEYKNSWQGVKDQASAAFAGLMGAVGTPILQMLIPAMQMATQVIKTLSSAFKSLPQPVQFVIGSLGAGIATVAAFAGVIGVAGRVLKGLKEGVDVIRGITTAVRGMSAISSIVSGVGSAFSSLFSILLANPIILVVVAVVALVAALVYLYYTNEDVRNAINGLGEALWGLGETIYNSLMSAFEWLLDTWNQVVNAFNTYAPLIAQVLFIMATGGVGAIILLIANMNGMHNQIGAILQSVITKIVNFVSRMVSNFTNGAKNSINNFLNQIRSLPGQFVAELNRMLSAVDRWAATLPQKFWEAGVNAVKNFLNALGIHSPGFMAVNFREELERMETSAQYNNIADHMGGTAKDIIHAWGSPELEYQINQLLDKESTDTKNDNTSLAELLRIIIDILSNLPKPEGGSFTFNHYGDTDSEDRMKKIIEAVRRDFYWNNEKAGRRTEELYGV